MRFKLCFALTFSYLIIFFFWEGRNLNVHEYIFPIHQFHIITYTKLPSLKYRLTWTNNVIILYLTFQILCLRSQKRRCTQHPTRGRSHRIPYLLFLPTTPAQSHLLPQSTSLQAPRTAQNIHHRYISYRNSTKGIKLRKSGFLIWDDEISFARTRKPIWGTDFNGSREQFETESKRRD